MSDSPNSGFGKLVPGFDFLQGLAKGTSHNMPAMPPLANWVAPTLDLEELDKRITELKAVQFWLDQNAMALKATIQALEVQKMTLATLKGMNFNMGDVANAFKLKVADTVAGGVQKVADKAKTFSGLEVPPTSYQNAETAAKAKTTKPKAEKAAEPAPGVVDPMQWWGALTQQFQNIATTAMQDAAKKTAMSTTKNMAAGLAKDAMKTTTGMATDLAKGMANSAGKTVARGARSAMDSAVRSSQARPTPAAAKTAARAKPKPKAKAPVRRAARKTTR